jgi:hypothetical protein
MGSAASNPPRKFVIAFLALGLAACGGQVGSGGNNIASQSTAPQATSAPAPTPVKAAPAACAPAPTLALAPDFTDPRFAANSAPYRQTEEHFAAAYRAACASGVLRGHALIAPGAAHPGQLLIKNAPDANVASIYRDGDDRAADMVLEYHFLASDGTVNVPGEEELGEAIYCAVRGATAQEEEESGRCLPD